MKSRKLMCVIAALPLATSIQAADLNDVLSIRSFGTLGLVHNSSDQASFNATIVGTPDGAGREDKTDYVNDTKFSTQLEWTINKRFSSTLQLVSRQYENRQWTPRVEWAFVKFQATNTLDLRIGRIRPPVYMLSDYLDVNYANPWVRPPVEQYYSLPISNMDGVDLLWRPTLGEYSVLVQPYFGEKTLKIGGGSKIETENRGLTVSATKGDFSYRVGYFKSENEIQYDVFTGLVATLEMICGFGDPFACAAPGLINISDLKYRFVSAGASWDNGEYFVSGEVGRSGTNTVIAAPNNTWYITAGKRFEKFTPYVTWSDFNTKAAAAYAASPFPATNQIMNSLVHSTPQSQHTFSAGVRYDLLSNISLKLQWDRTATECNHATPGTCKGLFQSPTAVFNSRENDVDLISISADFIF